MGGAAGSAHSKSSRSSIFYIRKGRNRENRDVGEIGPGTQSPGIEQAALERGTQNHKTSSKVHIMDACLGIWDGKKPSQNFGAAVIYFD